MLSHYTLDPSKREETRVEVLQEMLTLAKKRKAPQKEIKRIEDALSDATHTRYFGKKKVKMGPFIHDKNMLEVLNRPEVMDRPDYEQLVETHTKTPYTNIATPFTEGDKSYTSVTDNVDLDLSANEELMKQYGIPNQPTKTRKRRRVNGGKKKRSQSKSKKTTSKRRSKK